MTIPRLRLMACVILSQLLLTISNSIMCVYPKIDMFCWTHSLDCLFWKLNTMKVWKQFIQSRVLKIRKNLPSALWRHCPGSKNLADIQHIQQGFLF